MSRAHIPSAHTSSERVWLRICSKARDISLATVVGGTALALRHVRMASRTGLGGVRFLAEDQAEEDTLRALFERAPGPVSFPVEFGKNVANERDVEREVEVLGPAIYLGETLSAIASGSSVSPDFSLPSTASVREAEAFLFSKIRKSVQLDGAISYYLMRPIARVFTRLLLSTSVSPNQATLGALACGLTAAICAGVGGASMVALAGALYWAGGVIDHIDGELARMRLQSSKFGEWLDCMVDEASTVTLFAGLGIGMTRDGYSDTWMWLGLGGAAIAVMTLAPMYRDLHRLQLPIDTAQFPWFFGTTSSSSKPSGIVGRWVHLIGYFIRRDANLTITAILLLLNLRRESLLLMLVAYSIAGVLLITHYVVLRSRRPTEAQR